MRRKATTDSMKAERVQSPMKAERVQSRLKRLEEWRLTPDGKGITRTFGLPTFPAAVRFVDFVAELAEAAGHHPDIDIRYTKVTLTLTTHDAGGVTEMDLGLALLIDHRS